MENNVPFGYDLNGENIAFIAYKVTKRSMKLAVLKKTEKEYISTQMVEQMRSEISRLNIKRRDSNR